MADETEQTEVEVEVVDASAYPARPYSEAITTQHLQFLHDNAPEQAPR